MNHLIDTHVISEFSQDEPERAVIEWFQKYQNERLYLSVVTIGEIEQGIHRLPDSKKRTSLTNWLNDVLLKQFGDSILPIDVHVMRKWGQLSAELIADGRKMPVLDALIASTALHYDLVLVTRNVSDFKNTSVRIINPWEWIAK